MFGKLKDKLKSTLSIFSKKTEEEAVEEIVEVEQEILETSTPTTEEPISLKEIAPELSKDELLDLDAEESIDIEKQLRAQEEKEEIILEEVEKIIKPKKESLLSVHDLLSEELIEDDSETIEEKNKNKKHHKFTPEEIAPEPSKDELLDLDANEESDIEEMKESQDKEEAFIEELAKEVIDPVKTTKKKELKELKESKEIKKPILKEVIEEPTEKKGFFSKIKQKLTTKTINSEKFEELFWDLELVLLENNVSIKVIEKLKENLSNELVDKPLPRDVAGKIQEVLASTLKEILSVDKKNLIEEIKQAKANNQPYTIIFFGINGSGKTTTIAKLGHLLKAQGLSIVMAAGDTFRAAAIHQLQDHATKLDIKLIKHEYGSDAAAVAFDAKQYAIKNNIDVVLIDTAGRLHSNTNLMAELEKIMRVAKPDCKIFIGESITGNDCVEQAEKYTNTLGIDGIILTKADIDEMGGAPLSICYVTGKPILYLGMGQEYKDLVPFTAELILEKLGIE